MEERNVTLEEKLRANGDWFTLWVLGCYEGSQKKK